MQWNRENHVIYCEMTLNFNTQKLALNRRKNAPFISVCYFQWRHSYDNRTYQIWSRPPPICTNFNTFYKKTLFFQNFYSNLFEIDNNLYRKPSCVTQKKTRTKTQYKLVDTDTFNEWQQVNDAAQSDGARAFTVIALTLVQNLHQHNDMMYKYIARWQWCHLTVHVGYFSDDDEIWHIKSMVSDWTIGNFQRKSTIFFFFNKFDVTWTIKKWKDRSSYFEMNK